MALVHESASSFTTILAVRRTSPVLWTSSYGLHSEEYDWLHSCQYSKEHAYGLYQAGTILYHGLAPTVCQSTDEGG